jgi:hypothetical protein
MQQCCALFYRMLIHRPAWPFAIPQTPDRFTHLPHSVDMHTWTNQIVEYGRPKARARPCETHAQMLQCGAPFAVERTSLIAACPVVVALCRFQW